MKDLKTKPDYRYSKAAYMRELTQDRYEESQEVDTVNVKSTTIEHRKFGVIRRPARIVRAVNNSVEVDPDILNELCAIDFRLSQLDPCNHEDEMEARMLRDEYAALSVNAE